MIVNIATLLVFLVVTIAFGLLVRRAWRAKRWFVKWPGVILGGLLTLIFALITILAASGMSQAYMPRGSPVSDLKVQGTPEQIARGQHLANSICVGCHTLNGELPLSGGRDVGADLPVPLGSFFSINLTPAGPLKDWSDGEIMRVLREGVDRDGHPLLVMSSNGVRYLGDDDKQAIIAYLRNQPAVNNPTPYPPDQPSFLAAVTVGAGLIKFEAPVAAVTAPAKGVTPDYGKYVVNFEDCRFCHGDDLNGGTNPNFPKGPSLRVVLGWTQDQFTSTLRTGKDPSGHMLSDVMPWKDFARLDDVELGALHAYLKSLPSQ
ncbi:MAG TPA: c-type cytochrome [Anaerolineae bacterium]